VSTSAGAPLLQDISINHLTAFPAHFLFLVGDFVATSGMMKNFTFTNNLVTSGAALVSSTGGGSGNCAYFDKPITTFNACFTPYAFAGNVIASYLAAYPAGVWPAGNSIVSTTGFDSNFVNYSNGKGGDYHVQSIQKQGVGRQRPRSGPRPSAAIHAGV
jgi:hypothetical protein